MKKITFFSDNPKYSVKYFFQTAIIYIKLIKIIQDKIWIKK